MHLERSVGLASHSKVLALAIGLSLPLGAAAWSAPQPAAQPADPEVEPALELGTEAQPADPEVLKAATVRITVEHGEGSSKGAGIILCHRGGRLDILTAKHVLTGRGLVDDSGAPSKRFPDVKSYEVAFYRGSPLPIRAAVHSEKAIVKKAEFRDLALLTVAGVEGRLTTARLGDSKALRSGVAVESVGHVDVDWDWTRGEVKSVGEFIRHSSSIDQGYSGGPLYDSAGEVVGLNLQTKRGVARAMRIDEAMFTVGGWIDPQCLETVASASPPPASRRSPQPAFQPADPSEPSAGQRDVEQVRGVDFVWRYIPAGSFLMGSPPSEEGRDITEQLHRVTLTRGFWMGETEVTQAQWTALMAGNPRFQACGPDCPMEMVNWFWAAAFANALSRHSGLEGCYLGTGSDGMITDRDLVNGSVSFRGLDCPGYRLPTEAEWEYAARAGTTTPVYSGEMTRCDQQLCPALDEIAWWIRNSSVTYPGGVYCSFGTGKRFCGTHPVGLKKRNAWGLADMLGNVLEWTEDAADYGSRDGGIVTDTYIDGVQDPLSTWGQARIARGSSWSIERICRAASRFALLPGTRRPDLGFRLVRSSP